jgi:hypothetical protein
MAAVQMHEFRKSSFIIIVIAFPKNKPWKPENGNRSRYHNPFFANDTKFCKNLFYDKHGERPQVLQIWSK